MYIVSFSPLNGWKISLGTARGIVSRCITFFKKIDKKNTATVLIFFSIIVYVYVYITSFVRHLHVVRVLLCQ